jgi:hypothetical protein
MQICDATANVLVAGSSKASRTVGVSVNNGEQNGFEIDRNRLMTNHGYRFVKVDKRLDAGAQ